METIISGRDILGHVTFVKVKQDVIKSFMDAEDTEGSLHPSRAYDVVFDASHNAVKELTLDYMLTLADDVMAEHKMLAQSECTLYDWLVMIEVELAVIVDRCLRNELKERFPDVKYEDDEFWKVRTEKHNSDIEMENATLLKLGDVNLC